MQECHEQRDIFAGECMEDNSGMGAFESNVDVDALLFKGSTHEGVRELIRRVNPHTGCKCAKGQCEDSFNRLASLGLGKVSNLKINNKKS